MSEFFDIYDEALNHLGRKARSAVHRDGLWHQVFHCWVIGRSPAGRQFVILQRRASGKDFFPGKLDISAAGHLEAGESVPDGIREIEEELGLRVDFDDLIPLGRRIGVSKEAGLIDRQICHVFFCECDQSLERYTFPRDEVAGLLKLDIEDGLRLFAGERDSVRAEAVGLGAPAVDISVDEFIPQVDNYVMKILILARRYFAGERHLWI